MKYKDLEIKKIRRDGGAQFREGLNQSHIADMADALNEGGTLPAIEVFFDGSDYWLSDGEHRIEAHLSAGRTVIHARVMDGDQLAARRAGRKANSEHLALKRSAKAKRAAVIDALTNDPLWTNWSNRAIAKGCGVDEKFVRQVRNDLGLTADIRSEGVTYRDKHGNVTTMKTGNIGRQSDTEGVADGDAFLAEAATKIKGLMETSINDTASFGAQLRGAKELMTEDQFKEWIELEFQGNIEGARLLMEFEQQSKQRDSYSQAKLSELGFEAAKAFGLFESEFINRLSLEPSSQS